MNKNFFASLFDFKFETYITKQVASVMYAILTILVSLGTVIFFLLSIVQLGNSYTAGPALLVMILTPVAGLLLLTSLRVAFESSIALIDIAMNTKK
ncbi:MAG: DUF4282 domain-containing protein [Rhodoluna sp.]|nr:DUF4282 domain-containing protein [Rhodoluna sp.]